MKGEDQVQTENLRTEMAKIDINITKSIRIRLIKEDKPFLALALSDMKCRVNVLSDSTADIKGNVDNLGTFLFHHYCC